MNETQFKTLKELSIEGAISQRDLSKRIGLSLGNINYCVKALIDKGYVKAKRFKNSNHKMGYIYILTPKGINEKMKQTQFFLKKKVEEYGRLEKEIEELQRENM
jgi:EPS-associated MarR family transcriptional regulator